MGSADAVAACIAATDDQYVLAFCRHEVFLLEFHSGEDAVLLRQHLQGEVDALELSAGNFQIARRGRAGSPHVGVEAFGQVADVDAGVVSERDAFLLEDVHPAVDDDFVEFEVGDAVAQQSARILAGVEYGDGVAHKVEPVGRDESGRPRTDDGHFPAVALWLYDLHEVFGIGVLSDGGLVLAVGGRFVVDEVQHAGLLAECRTDAPREFGEVVGGVEQLVGPFPVAVIEGVVPLWRFVAERTGPVAEGHAAVHAARGLELSVVGVECLLHFAEVVYSVVQGAISRFFAGDSKKSFWISHALMFYAGCRGEHRA